MPRYPKLSEQGTWRNVGAWVRSMLERNAAPVALVAVDEDGEIHICMPPPDVMSPPKVGEALLYAGHRLITGRVRTEVVKMSAAAIPPLGSQNSKEPPPRQEGEGESS